MKPPWPEEAIEDIKGLVGRPLAEIRETLNRKYGTSFTKGAIAGKIHRLGLSSHRKTVTVAPRSTPRKPPDRTVRLSPRRVIEVAVVDVKPLNVSLMQLEDCMCRWPTGDDAYCGLPTPRRFSYCDKHHAVGAMSPNLYRGVWSSRRATGKRPLTES